LYEYIFDRPYIAGSLARPPSENLSLFSAGEIPYFAPSYRRYLVLASVLGVAVIFSAVLWLILTAPLRRLANEIEEIPAVMVTAVEHKPSRTQPELSISLRTPLSGPVALHLYDAATGELLADTSIQTEARLPVPAQRRLLLLSEAPLCFPLLDTIEASGAGATIEHPLAFEKLGALVGKPIVLDNIHFEPGSAQLRADSMPWLDALARALAGDSTVSVTLYGYTDSQGNPQTNLRLSRLRAEQVLTALLRGGVAYERLHAVGMGSQNPRASNITADGRARNRRVELVLSLR
ncbi:MAG: OmpA family protein, partial [Chlorobiota bacterium]